jgi:integrase
VVHRQRIEGTTKGGRSRTISIDSETVIVLRELRCRQVEECRSAGTAWNDNGGLVFTTRWGEPLYPDSLSALTTLLLAGVPVHVVAARLGHADQAVTLRVYAHVLREQAANVDDIFAQAVKAPVSKSVSRSTRED